MNQLDTINEMLDAIEEFVGYRLYKIERSQVATDIYRLDMYDKNNTRLGFERIGSLNEMYMYVAGMYRIITLVQTRVGVSKIG